VPRHETARHRKYQHEVPIYRLELAGELPNRRQISKNSVAWLYTDIAQWAEFAAGQPTPGNIRCAAALGWCDL
jgi:Prophage CP4-57 regulatory protein (AlpA)